MTSQVAYMIQQIKERMEMAINTSEWMDMSTKSEALGKVYKS